MTDEEFRLECLKLASTIHPRTIGFDEYSLKHNLNIPRFVQLDANKYFAYIKEGHIVEETKV